MARMNAVARSSVEKESSAVMVAATTIDVVATAGGIAGMAQTKEVVARRETAAWASCAVWMTVAA